MIYLLLVIGFVILVLGADWLVDGATGLARRYHVPDIVIGLTIVAFGTSLPEFCVNLISTIKGSTELAITNVLGSNIINACVVLGMSALIWPVASRDRSRHFDIPLSVLAGASVLILALVGMPDGRGEHGITRLGGIILLLILCFYMYYNMRHLDRTEEAHGTGRPMPLWKSLGLIVLGLVGLALGAELIVDKATILATQWGIPQSVIGVTIVALGTSLPELATSVVAALKHNSDLALGNVVGSNIFNVFLVLGVSATIRPLPVYDGFVIDALMTTLSCFFIWICTQGRKHTVPRWGGAVLIVMYGAYLAHLLSNL